MLDVAPEFTLEFIRDTFPKLVDVVTDALGPAAEQSPLVTSGALPNANWATCSCAA